MRAFVICLAVAAAIANVSAVAGPIDNVQYSMSCTADGSSLTLGVNACSAGSVGTGNTYAAASAKLTATVADNPLEYSDFRAAQTVSLNPSPQSTSSASATSSVSFFKNFTTAGPLRSGFMFVQLIDHNVSAEDNVLGGGTFYNYLLRNSSPDAGASCGMDVAQRQCGLSADYLRHFDNLGGFSVVLGQTFSLEFEGWLSGYASPLTGNGSSSLDLDYQFRFVESDGVTPVQVLAAAPEPATWQMLGLACTGLALVRKRWTKLSRSSRTDLAPLV